ncbi:ribonuclease H, partial [Trifolium medium]|nr:ribonuclease H [Trifolium medium]
MLTKPKTSGGLGLRRLDVVNKACILKWGRKLQTGSQDLWCEVLRSKYRTTEHGEVIDRSNDSHLWKAIVKLWPKLEEHSFWATGNGMNANICSDVWIDKGKIVIADMYKSSCSFDDVDTTRKSG